MPCPSRLRAELQNLASTIVVDDLPRPDGLPSKATDEMSMTCRLAADLPNDIGRFHIRSVPRHRLANNRVAETLVTGEVASPAMRDTVTYVERVHRVVVVGG